MQSASKQSSKSFLSNTISKGGKYLPATGKIRALAVYIQFKDDDFQDDHWKLNQIPDWSDELSKKVQNYFKEMSFGKLNLEIETYPEVFIPPQKEIIYSYYSNGYGVINKEALTAADKKISFLPYDNWILDGDYYKFKPGQDGIIDLVVMIYRRVSYRGILAFYGIADLGFAYEHRVDNDKRIVWGGYPGDEHKDGSASGVTICNAPGTGMKMDIATAEKLLCHEISHKFFGEGHFIYSFASLGQLSNAYGGGGFHSFERAFLGYTNYIIADSTLTDPIVLNDYMTTGEACLIKIPNLDFQYYIVENRQKLSVYDEAFRSGLYIYQVYFAGANSSIDIQSADGKWSWNLEKNNQIVKSSPDPIGGKTHLEVITLNSLNYWPPDMNGNEYDAFYPGYKTVYSPWTNPCSNAFNFGIQNIPTKISITLHDIKNGKASIKVDYNSSITAIDEVTLPKYYDLKQNYPNPFNSSTKIEYYLPSITKLELAVYNTLGQKIAVLFDGEQNAGKHEINFSADKLAGGVYFYQLKTKEYTETKKLLLLK